MNTSEFIEKSKLIHGDKYDYRLTEYINKSIKVNIICKLHGAFLQNSRDHLSGSGCKICAHLKLSNRFLQDYNFVEKSKLIHGDKYDYSKVCYIGARKKVNIICSEHGGFLQKANNHLSGQGCPICANIIRGNHRRKNEEFIERSRLVHGDLYRYDKVNYLTNKELVDICCLIHGEFKQSPNNHLAGNGCPFCKSSYGEREISKYLDSNNIKYLREYKFDRCFYIDKLPFDFYLPEYNLCIEFNGIQHYEPVDFFGGINSLEKQLIRDSIKNKYCLDNKINLLIIKYNDDVYYSLSNYL
jgi:hypothetical protein